MATKKYLVKSMLMSILTVGIVSSVTSCRDDFDLPANDENESVDVEGWVEPVSYKAICNKRVVYISQAGNIPGELQQAVGTCFPNRVGSLEEAEIAIVDVATAKGQDRRIRKFCERGGLMVCLFPNQGKVLWATHGEGDDYYLIDGPDEAPATDEEGNQTVVQVVKDQNYWNGRLLPFVNWIEYRDKEMCNAYQTRGVNDVPDFKNLTINMNNGAKRFEVNYPFTLYHEICKGRAYAADNLYKEGSVTMRFEVMPIYMQSVNGDNAGDYYAVRSTVIPHNGLVWQPFTGEHGASRSRVYGYWFNDMDYEFVLVDPDTNQPAAGLHFADLPYPENSISSRNRSDSHTVGVNGSLTLGGKLNKEGAEGSISGSVGFSCSWTESISYTLANIDYSRNSSSNWVKYHWYSNNVVLKDDMSDYQKYFPNDVHQEFDAKNIWMWHVPYNRAGVKDGSNKEFNIFARVHPRYSSWYHWRGTTCFKKNRKDWDVDFAGTCTSTDSSIEKDFTTDGWAGCTFSVPAPDRSTWGVISLKNASSYTMRSIKIYAKGKENQAPVAEIPSTYASQELAKTAVLEGTYTVTFEFINPDNNQVISKGVVNNVKVKMGTSLDAATTNISTGDAKLN